MTENSRSENTSQPQPALPAHQTADSKPKVSISTSLREVLGTGLVLIALAALGFWGHHAGWRMPKFSELTRSHPPSNEDWCSDHGVPESQCVECDATLMPRQEYGWCKTHGIPNCPFEHPEVAQLKTEPKITAAQLERARRALQFAKRPENNNKCQLHLRRIQFASKEATEKAGVDVAPVWEAPVVEAVSASGQITYDQTRTARLSTRVPGTVFRVFKQAGDRAVQGEVLALVDAAEVGKAKSEFLTAQVQVRLKSQTLERMEQALSAIPEVSYRNQAAALSEAKIRLTTTQEAMTNLGLAVDAESLRDVPQEKLADRLRFLGLPESVTASLDPKKTTGNLLAVTAPFDGAVVARQVVSGEVVDNQKGLFVVVDTRQMWLTLDLRAEDAKHVTVGQRVLFRPDGGDEEFSGQISWVSTAVDEKTRTVKVRADLDNAAGRLRAFTFGAGRIILREEKNAVVVPNEAIQSDGDCLVVFVRDKNYFDADAPKVFHVRTVRTAARHEQWTEIAAGVLPGEVVATKGSGVLRAELLKNNLGQG